MAQMHASNGSLIFKAALITHSMGNVTGGRTGFLREPWIFSSLHRDQFIWLWCSLDNGAGHPWAMCHAHMAARYVFPYRGNRYHFELSDVGPGHQQGWVRDCPNCK